MFELSSVKIEKIIVHQVGNKLQKEGVVLSNSQLFFNAEMENLLLSYFLKNFKTDNGYRFSSNAGIDKTPNEIFRYVSDLFDEPEGMQEISIDIARHLYNQSTHPKVNGGDLFVVYFSGLNTEDIEDVDAIGIFKSEIKDSFIKLEEKDHKFNIESLKGINISKIDKGCIILNTEKSSGYRAYVLDNNKSASKYWKEQFLDVQQIYTGEDYTAQLLKTCDSFVKKSLDERVEDEETKEKVKKNIVDTLRNSETFEKDKFVDDVFGVLEDGELNFQASLAFQELYTNNLNKLGGLSDQASYSLDSEVVEKNIKKFNDIIVLDTGIEIKIDAKSLHQKSELIEKCYDKEKKSQYYKVYFNEEL